MSSPSDFALKGDIESEHLEIELIKNGSQIEIMRTTQPKPWRWWNSLTLRRRRDWTLNNGILDITLKLTPKERRWRRMMTILPAPGEVSIDLGDDDDDEDDGGIPIFEGREHNEQSDWN